MHTKQPLEVVVAIVASVILQPVWGYHLHLYLFLFNFFYS